MISRTSCHSLIASAAMFLLAAAAAAPIACAKISNRYLEQYANVMRQVLQADAIMFQDMQIVGKRLDRYYQRNKHFPATNEEQEAFRKEVGRYVQLNPYQPKITDLYTHQAVAPDQALPIYFLTDSGLNEQNIAGFIKAAPPSWQGEPGSIFILTNGAGLYMVWAASADRLPIRNFAENSAPLRVIVRNFGYSDGTALSDLTAGSKQTQ